MIENAFEFKCFVDSMDFCKNSLSNMIYLDEIVVLWMKGIKLSLIIGVLLLYTYPPLVTKVRALHVFWQIVSMKRNPPLIIAKTVGIKGASDIYIFEIEKTWCTHAAIRKRVDLVLPFALRDVQRGMLMWNYVSIY